MINRTKFRVWDLIEKRFKKPDEIVLNGNGDVFDKKSQENRNNEYVVQLFSGFVDRKNNEIYEGDIVKILNSNKEEEVIVSYRGCFCFHEKNAQEGSNYNYLYDLISNSNVEIVGHIFQQ